MPGVHRPLQPDRRPRWNRGQGARDRIPTGIRQGGVTLSVAFSWILWICLDIKTRLLTSTCYMYVFV